MRFSNLVICFSLGLSVLACNKAGKKDQGLGDNGSSTQPQVYTDALDVNKPLLVVYGDSLSTGVLANTTLGKNPDNSLTLQLVEYVKQEEFNATGFQESLSNFDIAAATTKEAYGFRASFGAESNVTADQVGVISLAKFGGKSVDLSHQLASWQELHKTTIKKKPEYIFVMMGGNDFCSDFTAEDIVKTYSEQTMAIHKDSPDAQIVIAPTPPIAQLAAIDFTYGPALSQITGEELTCHKFREKLCKRIYDDPALVKERTDAINAGIKSAADALKADGAKVVYVDAMNSWQLKPEELAVDCFHPSALGQQTIGNFVKASLATPL